MTVIEIGTLDDLTARLAAVVAATLRIPIALVEPDTPFTALGMDSLAAVELTAAIEDALGIDLPLTAVHECDDLDSLARFIEERSDGRPTRVRHQRMLRDAVLPPDIRPSFTSSGRPRGSRTATARNFLVTGATGFVGAHLVRTLLDETDVTITCLVRPSGDATDRVRRNLERYALWRSGNESRIRVVRGDLSAFLLGLRAETFLRLAEEVDAIYHGGAAVNWVHGYDRLRDANVIGTREILRFACTGDPKPVHFLSSLGVCYSTRGPRVVDECDDMLGAIDGLHLGYAQSKCVAESLVRAASARGLPVTIARPALVSGDSRSGRSNVDDLLARFMAGCIRLGAAPDLDWRVDCVPADHVARAVVHLSRAHVDGLSVAHLSNPRARHWRECVLWMRLCGYEIDLLPYREWLSAFRATTDKTNPLHPLRAFFIRSVSDEGDLTLPELYEESRRSMASAGVTDSRLAAAGLECPPLNAKLLDSYFACYVKEAIVPATARHDRGRERPTGIVLPIADALPDITTSLAEQFGDPQLLVGGCRIAPFETDDSIVAELTSWRHGTSTGLFLLEVDLAGGVSTPASTKLVVKAKPSDQHILEVGEAIARLASPELGEAYACFRDDVGFTRSHLRELALFSHPDPRLRRNTPRAHAVVRDDAAERWVIVMERVEGTVRLPSADSDVPWLPGHIDAALRGLAEIHAISYGRENELRTEPWLGPVRDVERLRAMRPLWATLAQHAQKHSAAWRVEGLAAIHDRLVSDVAAWAELPTGPRTLIHNDFNPRNITLRDGGTPGLCAYDWELATIGLPQRDLAEFLAFTLSMDVTPVEVAHWIERYRRLLEHATGAPIDRSQWHAGFRSALGELLVDRLAMYAMVDRFRPQRFLPRVVRTWKRIYEAAI